MTGLTVRYHLMLIPMAVHTEQTLMFAPVFCKDIDDLEVTFGAPAIRYPGIVPDHIRHMWLVAAQTIFVSHIGTVPLVTNQATLPASVTGVTFSTIEFAVQAGIIDHLPSLLEMAGTTYRVDRLDTGKIDFEWGMRRVTNQALL